MFVPALRELVRAKNSPEIFRVVAFNLTAHTADLIRPGSDVIEHGVPWAMLEAVGDDGASWLLARLVSQPTRVCFQQFLIVSFALSR
jgi:hypothetical protein